MYKYFFHDLLNISGVVTSRMSIKIVHDSKNTCRNKNHLGHRDEKTDAPGSFSKLLRLNWSEIGEINAGVIINNKVLSRLTNQFMLVVLYSLHILTADCYSCDS